MTEHPSQFALEAYAVGEVDPSVDAHVRDCSVCQGYVRELLDERSAFLNAHPAASFLDTAPIREAFAEVSSPPGSALVAESQTMVANGGGVCAPRDVDPSCPRYTPSNPTIFTRFKRTLARHD